MAETPWLTYDDFVDLRGSAFDVLVDGDPAVRLTLAEATPFGAEGEPPAEGRRRPFSLVLTGPPSPALGQGTWDLRHRSLGTVAIFLVPIAPVGGEARYEAIFS